MSCSTSLGIPSTRLSCAAPSTPPASAPMARAVISSTTQTNGSPRHPGTPPGTWEACEALHLGFTREPKLHHSLWFSGFRSGHHQPPWGVGGVVGWGDWSRLCCWTAPRRPPPRPLPALSTRWPRGAAPRQRLRRSAAVLYRPGDAEDLLPSGALCATCSATSYANNAFPISRELSSLIRLLAIQTHSFPPWPAAGPSSPARAAICLIRPCSTSSSSPRDSLSGRDSYLSG